MGRCAFAWAFPRFRLLARSLAGAARGLNFGALCGLAFERQEMAGDGRLVVEKAPGRVDDRFGADRLDPRRPFLNVIEGLADRQRRPIPAREVRLAVAGVGRVGDEPGPRALEVARVDALVQEPRQRPVER